MPSNKDIGVADILFAHYDAGLGGPAGPVSTGAMTDQRPHAQAMVARATVAAGGGTALRVALVEPATTITSH